jgi:glycosyltransferase involved in cell wall biosynthesis
MKIGFIFPTQFSILTVLQKPLGGSESAVSFLATELSKLGHDIYLFSFCGPSIEVMGIKNLNFSINNSEVNFPSELFEEDFDYLIIKNGLPELGRILRSSLKSSVKIIFWTGHAFDQPAIQDLEIKENVDSFSKIVCVSNWQKNTFMKKFSIKEEKITVIRNAISPFFENLYSCEEEFIKLKPKYPCLTYTSTPFRGLELLLKIFPLLKKQIENSQLQIYSSMQVYGVNNAQDQFKSLYELAKKTLGVEYFGSIPQFKLGTRLRECSIFSYPNTFSETSCIAMMEALAAGLFVVTTDLGALSETALSYGRLVEKSELQGDGNGSYLSIILEVAKSQIENTKEFYDKLYLQTIEMNKNHTWRIRAREWVDLFTCS